MNTDPIWQTWEWLGRELGKPEVLTAMAVLLGFGLILAVLAALLFRLIFSKHLDDIVDWLLRNQDSRYRRAGLTRGALLILARSLAVIVVFKVVAEVLEPLATLTPYREMLAERYVSISVYDWIVASVIALTSVVYFFRFLTAVRRHDRARPDSKIRRNLSRALPLYWKPATTLLVLMMLPDIGRKATSVVADAAAKSEFMSFVSVDRR